MNFLAKYFPAKTIFAAALAVAGLAATVETSSAMTPAPVAQGASPLLQDVRWGCGPGWRPNNWGRCVPERRGPAYFYGYGGPRGDWGRRDRYWGRGDGGWGGRGYRQERRWNRY